MSQGRPVVSVEGSVTISYSNPVCNVLVLATQTPVKFQKEILSFQMVNARVQETQLCMNSDEKFLRLPVWF